MNATDADAPNTDNSDIRYRIISQDPPSPADGMFAINSVTGGIRVNAIGLDREVRPFQQMDITCYFKVWWTAHFNFYLLFLFERWVKYEI